MNKKYIKIGVITLVSLGAIYGGYRLVKYVIDHKDKGDKTPVEEETASHVAEVKATAKPAFDGNKVVKKGSKGDEAGAIQTAFNNIINDMKKAVVKASPILPTTNVNQNMIYSQNLGFMPAINQSNPSVSTGSEARRKEIASLKQLVVDGDFGSGSETVMKKIMGATSTTYNKVKQKRKDLAKAYGLPSPY